MRAARFYTARDIRVEDVPVPEAVAGSVLVDIEWCGICGSDLHEYIAGPLFVPTKDRPHKLTGEHVPVTMGHEFCGRVSQLPDGYIGTLRVGQPVMVDPRIVCRSCDSCQSTLTHCCRHLGFTGLSGWGGGLSETVAVSVDMCYPLPDGVDLRVAALIEPLAVAEHAVRVSGFTAFTKSNVLVLGGGPIGQAVLLALKAEKVGQVIVSEPTELRRKQVEKLADHIIDSKTEDVPARCRELTAGKGADMVFDCAGVGPAMIDGFGALVVRGTYVNVAGWEGAFTIPMGLFMLKEIIVRGSMAYDDQDFADTVRNFSEGKYSGLDAMVTARISLEDVVQGGFEQLVNNKDNHVKILVTPKSELISATR